MARLGIVWEILPAFKKKPRRIEKRAMRIPKGMARLEAIHSVIATNARCSKVFCCNKERFSFKNW